ncbi:hypothetical protein EDD11_001241, partial [Mortierella claussenii]
MDFTSYEPENLVDGPLLSSVLPARKFRKYSRRLAQDGIHRLYQVLTDNLSAIDSWDSIRHRHNLRGRVRSWYAGIVHHLSSDATDTINEPAAVIPDDCPVPRGPVEDEVEDDDEPLIDRRRECRQEATLSASDPLPANRDHGSTHATDTRDDDEENDYE